MDIFGSFFVFVKMTWHEAVLGCGTSYGFHSFNRGVKLAVGLGCSALEISHILLPHGRAAWFRLGTLSGLTLGSLYFLFSS